jgi:hypothetical protein
MDSLEKKTHSLIFRADFQNLFLKDLKKVLLTPQERIIRFLAAISEGLKEKTLTTSMTMQILGALRTAFLKEKEGILKQTTVFSQKEASCILRQVLSAISKLETDTSRCMAALHEGTPFDFEEALALLQKDLTTYKEWMENLIAFNETQGWLLLQRFRGPFSPILNVLGFGITFHLAGLMTEKSFKNFLQMIKEEMLFCFKEFKPNFFFNKAWEKIRNEAETAFECVRLSFLNRETILSGIVDPTSLRCALGVFAKTLCQLNLLASSFHPEKAEKQFAFSAECEICPTGKMKNKHILTFPPQFFEKAFPISSN